MIEIKFKVDIKTIRKAFALIGENIPSDDELNEKLSKVVVDLSNEKDEDSKNAELGFALCAISKAFA